MSDEYRYAIRGYIDRQISRSDWPDDLRAIIENEESEAFSFALIAWIIVPLGLYALAAMAFILFLSLSFYSILGLLSPIVIALVFHREIGLLIHSHVCKTIFFSILRD